MPWQTKIGIDSPIRINSLTCSVWEESLGGMGSSLFIEDMGIKEGIFFKEIFKKNKAKNTYLVLLSSLCLFKLLLKTSQSFWGEIFQDEADGFLNSFIPFFWVIRIFNLSLRRSPPDQLFVFRINYIQD